MEIVLIHFYLQHLKLDCLFLGNACKISGGVFQLGYCPKIQNYVLHIDPKFRLKYFASKRRFQFAKVCVFS